jgi:hypothetical protein
MNEGYEYSWEGTKRYGMKELNIHEEELKDME